MADRLCYDCDDTGYVQRMSYNTHYGPPCHCSFFFSKGRNPCCVEGDPRNLLCWDKVIYELPPWKGFYRHAEYVGKCECECHKPVLG